MFNESTYPFNFMNTGDGVDSDLVIPDSFGQCLSYEQQIAFILKLIEDIDTGVIVPEITADATVDQSTGTPSVTVVKTGEDEAPVFTFNFHNIKGETGQRGEKGDTGETGATGRPGNDGADGISPTVTTAQIANGYRITITDADGSHVFDIYNGNDGETGPAGYSPTVTVQTITGGHSVTITDEDGDHTFNVLDGTDGSDGVSPVITSTAITGGHRITIVDAQGTTDVDVMDGATGATGNGIASTVLNQDYTLTITYTDGTTYTTPSIRGAQGAAGQNGTDGISPTVTVRSITGGHQIEIVSAGGTEQFDVMDGTSGSQGPAGPGVAAGGRANQMLMKKSATDYDTKWARNPLNPVGEIILREYGSNYPLCKITISTYPRWGYGFLVNVKPCGLDLIQPQLNTFNMSVNNATNTSRVTLDTYGIGSTDLDKILTAAIRQCAILSKDQFDGNEQFSCEYRNYIQDSTAVSNKTLANIPSYLLDFGGNSLTCDTQYQYSPLFILAKAATNYYTTELHMGQIVGFSWSSGDSKLTNVTYLSKTNLTVGVNDILIPVDGLNFYMV